MVDVLTTLNRLRVDLLRAIHLHQRDSVQTKSVLRVFGFCPTGSTSKVDLTLVSKGGGTQFDLLDKIRLFDKTVGD